MNQTTTNEKFCKYPEGTFLNSTYKCVDPLYVVNKYHVLLMKDMDSNKPCLFITHNSTHTTESYCADALLWYEARLAAYNNSADYQMTALASIKDFLQLPYEDMPLHLNDKHFKEIAAFRIKMGE
jgi:hypothetical protein